MVLLCNSAVSIARCGLSADGQSLWIKATEVEEPETLLVYQPHRPLLGEDPFPKVPISDIQARIQHTRETVPLGDDEVEPDLIHEASGRKLLDSQLRAHTLPPRQKPTGFGAVLNGKEASVVGSALSNLAQ